MSQRHDTDSPVTIVEPLPPARAQPRVQRFFVGTVIAALATLWLAATGWLLATW